MNLQNVNKMEKIVGKDMLFDNKRFKRQHKKLKHLFKEYDLQQSMKAMNIALRCHTGKRKDGNAEVSHQFEIVSMVIPLFLNFDKNILDSLVSAMFLHDVVEDYPELYSFIQLKQDFNHTVFEIVKRMTKTASFKKTSSHYAKYYNKLEKHPLAVIAKLFDRIHNYESMGVRPLSFKKKYFIEVDTYMIPMAKRTRRLYPKYEQMITFLIRQLKVLTKMHLAQIELEEQLLMLKK